MPCSHPMAQTVQTIAGLAKVVQTVQSVAGLSHNSLLVGTEKKGKPGNKIQNFQ